MANKGVSFTVRHRLNIIEQLLLEGRGTVSKIWPLVESWGLSKSRIAKYVTLAKRRLHSGLETDRQQILAKHIAARYKELERIRRKGRKKVFDEDGQQVFDGDGKPVYSDETDDRHVLEIMKDIARLEGAYEDTHIIKGGLNNVNATVDISLSSEEGQRIAEELGVLVGEKTEKDVKDES